MDELLGRQMPHSPQAEQAVIGSMLIDARCVPEVVGRLRASDFYVKANRDIFETIYSMFNYSRVIDPVTVLEQMRVSGSAAEGTAAYLKDMIVRFNNPDWKQSGKPTSDIMRFYRNVNEAVSVNTSISAKLLLENWRASLTYTNLFIRQTEEGKWIEINGKAPHQVMASVSYTVPAIGTNLSLNGTWHAPKPGGKNNILDGTYSSDYLMVNFRVEQSLLEDSLLVYGGIRNMLNNVSFVKGSNGETMADGFESDEGLVIYLGARYQY